MALEAVIFDMDGVLIDSVSSAHKARETLLAEHGLSMAVIPDPRGEDHRGASAKALLHAVEQHHGVSIDLDDFKQRAGHMIRQDLKDREQSADPGLVRFLEDLRAHGIACAITSSGAKNSVAFKLEILGIEHFFSAIVTADDVAAHKPDPASYFYTMGYLGVQPQNCLIIEDSLTGIEAAIASGARVAGFSKYNTKPETFDGLDLVASDWSELSYQKISQPAPTLYIMCGFPFAGKSTIARAMVEQLGVVRVALDDITTELGASADPAMVGSDEQWQHTHDVFYERIIQALQAGQSVVVDSVAYKRLHRNGLRKAARRFGARAVVVYVETTADTSKQRWITNRTTRQRPDVRDENYTSVTGNFEPPQADEATITVNNDMPLAEIIRKLAR